MLQHVSVTHSFLLVNNILIFGNYMGKKLYYLCTLFQDGKESVNKIFVIERNIGSEPLI